MKKFKPIYLAGLLAALILIALSFYLLNGYSPRITDTLSNLDISTLPTSDAEHSQAIAIGRTLGIVSLLPVVITVVLAFVTKEVILSLFIGILSGLVILEGATGSGGFFSRLGGIFSATGGTIVGTLTDSFKSSIIVLCLCIGGMVSTIKAAGGFHALGRRLTRNINSPKRAVIVAQGMGLCLFFDDYANSLITGPVMREITDKQGVSREKLAYIVDSSAAPVAGIAVISSWIAAELSSIELGFQLAGINGNAYSYFFSSIPYCFYNFLAIAMVLGTALMGREYGPMLFAERRARKEMKLKGHIRETEENVPDKGESNSGSIWSAILPIATLIVYSLTGFALSGISNATELGLISENQGLTLNTIAVAFGNADTVEVLMQAALLSSIVSIFMGCVTGSFNIISGINSWLKGMSAIMGTVVILVLAWGLSFVVGRLGTAYYLVTDYQPAAYPAAKGHSGG